MRLVAALGIADTGPTGDENGRAVNDGEPTPPRDGVWCEDGGRGGRPGVDASLLRAPPRVGVETADGAASSGATGVGAVVGAVVAAVVAAAVPEWLRTGLPTAGPTAASNSRR